MRILEIPETTFWSAPISELKTIADNKAAYDAWLSAEMERERKRSR